MRRADQLGLVVVLTFALASVSAQDLTETFCETPPEKCTDDNLSMTFEGVDGNIFTYDTFVQDMEINAVIMMDTKSDQVQGWSYSVVHQIGDVVISQSPNPDFDPTKPPDDISNPEFLDDLTTEGTDAGDNLGALPFDQRKAVLNDVNGEMRAGFISAVVLNLLGGAVMPVKMNSILKAKYLLQRDVGTEGTVLRFASQEIGVPGSPTVEINVTNAGDSLAPRLLTHGMIRKSGGGGGPTGCEEGTPTDGLFFGAVQAGEFAADGNTIAVVSRNAADLSGFSFGVKTDVAADAQTWSFTGDAGNNDLNGDPVPIEMNFTNSDGVGIEPAAGNTASAANADPITNITRGSAISGFEGNDFFAFDTNPDFGGPGFTVGYVAGITQAGAGNVIPTTPSPEDSCPSNELLVVTIGGEGGAPFFRGDSNGDGKISVTDGVLIIQNVVGNIPANYPNCPAINDANNDGSNDLTDGVFLLNYIFRKGSPVPPAPFRTCETAVGANCTESNCG